MPFTGLSDGDITALGPAAFPIDGPIEDWCAEEDVKNAPKGAQVEVADAIRAASEILYDLTGGDFPGRAKTTQTWPLPPSAVNRTAETLFIGGNYPVAGILEVKVDGIVLAASGEWRFEAPNRLVRLGLGGVARSWTTNTVEVTYAYGRAVPERGKLAAAELAGEIARLYPNTPENCIPRGAERLTRGQTSVDVKAIRDQLAAGDIPLPMVRLFLTSWKAARDSHLAMVWSPDTDSAAAFTPAWAPWTPPPGFTSWWW